MQQGMISLKITWATKSWRYRVFSFPLSIMEVNVYNALMFFFGGEKTSTIHNRKVLAFEMIHNPYLEEVNEQSTRKLKRCAANVEHKIENLPIFSKFCGSELVESNSP